MDADRFEQATPLEVYAAVPVMAAGMVEQRADLEQRNDPQSVRVPTDADLTWYEYRVIAAEVDGTRYIDIEAFLPEAWRDPPDPVGWRARVDLADKRITTLEIDD